MNTFTIYKGIKQRLSSIAPCFYFLGQYLKGKDNTSYVVPAIYIEMPKNLNVAYYNKVRTNKEAQVKIHLVTNAVYKNHDTMVQDSAIAEHENKLNLINDAMTGWSLTNPNQKLLTNQFVPVFDNVGNFDGVKLYSVLTYTTEFYNR